MARALIPVIIVVDGLRLNIRRTQLRLVPQLVKQVALEAAEDQEQAHHEHDDQCHEEGLVVEAGLGDVGQVERHVWDGKQASDDVENSPDNRARSSKAASALERHTLEGLFARCKIHFITPDILVLRCAQLLHIYVLQLDLLVRVHNF